MGILSLFGLGAIFAIDKSRANGLLKRREQEMEVTGANRPFDPVKNSMFRQDVYNDWNNKRDLFPAEYIDYLMRNKNALDKYVTCLVSKMEHEAGLRPFHMLGYDKNDFNPFKGFEYCYAEKISIFNETGTFYV